MNSEKALLKMWQVIVYNDNLKNGLSSDDAWEFASEVHLTPIDEKHCLSQGDDATQFLLIQENGLIINTIEGRD